MNYWNDKADKLAKEGLLSNLILEVQDVTTSRVRVVPTWGDRLIDSPLRSFVNLTTSTLYECEWADLNNIRPLLDQRYDLLNNEGLNWRNTWNVLKKLQGRRCNSIKKSKALIFRVKCINKLLSTKDLCCQRNPELYKTKTCITCIAKEESLEHIAECQVYQIIWRRIEEFITEELGSKIYDKWDMLVSDQTLKRVFLGQDTTDILNRRRLYIRDLTSNNLISEVKNLLGSNSKASKAICWFTELFWSNFFERLWKFHCEVMAEWEERNNISTRKKKRRLKPKHKKSLNID